MTDKTKFEHWCLVELFGHQRIAGKVTEQAVGGCAFVRVDVPPVNDQPGFTKLFGNGAIYGITPVAEEIAVAAAKAYRVVPVTAYDLPELRQLRSQTALGLSDEPDDERVF